VLAVVVVGALVRRLRIAAGMRRGDQAVIDVKRKRNKLVGEAHPATPAV
jgi:hypothetical protein